jgi:tRNA(His) guanylyltransferase
MSLSTPATQPQGLGDRMKSYEAVYDTSLPESTPTILRLDGHGFSKFTARFIKPFDTRIHEAMVETCKNLLQDYPSATVAYTFSDEISLVFPDGVGAFNNRVQKIASLAASLASVQFNLHLKEAIDRPEASDLQPPRAPLPAACFDARLFVVPSKEEALNCLLWRCKVDGVRNSVNGLARTLYSTRELQGKKTAEVIEMMKQEKGVIYAESVPSWALAGTLVKRELVQVEGVNEATGEKVGATRTRITAVDKGVTEYSEENLRLVAEKYWHK